MKEHFEMEANTYNEITDSVTGEALKACLITRYLERIDTHFHEYSFLLVLE